MKKHIFIILLFCLPFMAVGQDKDFLREYPLPNWTDTIMSQPEGYVADAEGNVEISSSDGLVWLISTVNGLNGCEPDDFNGRTVSLANDIDFGETGLNYCFSPIGTRETPFLGTFDGNGYRIMHLWQVYSRYVPDYHYYFDMGFFGYIRHAVVRNVTIDPTSGIGSSANDVDYYRGGVVGFADSLSIVENCHTSNSIGIHSYGGGVVGMNRNSTIRNCSCGGHNNSLGSPEEAGGVVAFNRSEAGYADAIVENCYFYGRVDPSYSTWYLGGLVCYNETVTNDNGKRAIVRNCHSTPTSDFWACKEDGVFAAANSERSCFSNCYTDFTKIDPHYLSMVGLNNGELDDCYSYTNINGVGTLSNPVTVNGVTTDNLLDALNLWIANQEHPELYRTWTIINDSIPVFGDYYVGVPENEADNGNILLYPNPTSDIVCILGPENAEVQIYNVMGQLVKIKQMVNEINLEGLPQGIYTLRIADERGFAVTRKVIKK